MSERIQHLDAEQVAFFQRQIEAVKAQTYDVRYPALKARQLFPVSGDIDPGAQRVVYYTYDQAGQAKIISDYAKDLPRVDVFGRETVATVRSLGDSYAYSTQEIRSARMAGTPLEARRAMAARQAIEQLINRLAFTGDEEYGLVGFVNHPDIPRTTAPADGTGNVTTWIDTNGAATKSAALIARDMGLLINGVMTQTSGVEMADYVVMPLEQYTYIATAQFSTASDVTILGWLQQAYPNVTFDWLPTELNGAGVDVADADVAIAFSRDPSKISLEIPMEFTQYEPEKRSLEYVIDCEARFAGIRLFYPFSAHILEGI